MVLRANPMHTAAGAREEPGRLRHLHELLLALNLGLAAAWWTLILFSRIDAPGRFPLLHRMVATIDRLAGHYPWTGGHSPGSEAIVDAWVLALALSFFGLLMLLRRTAARRMILDPLGGIIAFAAVPAVWLLTFPPVAYLADVGYLLTIELILACGVIILTRHWPIRAGCAAPYLAFHYGLWAWLTVTDLGRPSDVLPLLRYVLWPAAGVAWMLYASRSRRAPVNA